MGKVIGIVFGKKADQWQRIDEHGNSIDAGQGYFDSHPLWAGIKDEIIDGQSMVRVPVFYYRTGKVEYGEHAGKKAIWVSDGTETCSNFNAHPAFMHHGSRIDQFWVGKYQGTPDGEKLGSQPSLMPLVSIDFPAMQARGAARNTGGVSGFGLWSIYQLAAIQILALIEMGGSDSQTLIGPGNVTGQQGLLEVSNATVAQATWRGIVGLWGNVWQMVDGLQTDGERRFRIWDYDGNKSYVSTGIKTPASDWFHLRATKEGNGFDMGAVFVPKKTRDYRNDSAIGNYFWASENSVAYHGGNWGNSSDAGLFCLGVSGDASNSLPYLGGRLAKV